MNLHLIWADQDITCKIHIQSSAPRPVCEITPISKPYGTAESDMCNRDWQTHKNTPILEGQTLWFFLETPFWIFNSAKITDRTAERYLYDPLIRWTKMIMFWCYWTKVIEKMMKMKYLLGFLLLTIDAHNSNMWHLLICCWKYLLIYVTENG